MLYKWKPLHHFRKARIFSPLSSLKFTKPSVSAAKLDEEPFPTTTSSSIAPNPDGTVYDFPTGFKRFLGGHYFRGVVSMLNQAQFDQIIDGLRVDSPDFAVALFHLLRDEDRFRHSRVSRLVFWREKGG